MVTCGGTNHFVDGKAEEGRGYGDIRHGAVCGHAAREKPESEKSEQRSVGVGT